jgi:hypothetical protein
MADFVKQFDCKNIKHVIWLKELGSSMARSIGGGKSDISKTDQGKSFAGKAIYGQRDGFRLCTFPVVYEVHECGIKRGGVRPQSEMSCTHLM